VKTLALLRHAKSSWDDPAMSDFERPLNRRGRKDAPFMGDLLRKRGVDPDIIITSPANRALTTCRIVAGELGFPLDRITIDEHLYEASARELLRIVQMIGSQYNSAMLVGHNPGLTLLAERLAPAGIDNIPTCGFLSMRLDVETWSGVREKCGSVALFEYPKKYQE
jgi:phosphohistidine phosphatase